MRHAAFCTDRFQVKANGKTAYFSQRGKEYNGQVIPFGEAGLFKLITEDNFQDRWEKGIAIGRSEETDERFYLTEAGFKKARAAKRPPLAERFKDLLTKVKGLS